MGQLCTSSISIPSQSTPNTLHTPAPTAQARRPVTSGWGTPRTRERVLAQSCQHYLLQELQDVVPLLGQAFSLLGTLQMDLGSLSIQGSHPVLGDKQGLSRWGEGRGGGLAGGMGVLEGSPATWGLLPCVPTFLWAMLRWYSALLCSSCWLRVSRSSSSRLSLSSCWNSRSSNSLVSVSRASASLRHTMGQLLTPLPQCRGNGGGTRHRPRGMRSSQ